MHTSSSNGLMVSTIETNVSSDRAHTDSVQEQNSASDFTSTPNAHEGQTPTIDASQELRLGPRTHNGFKEAKQSSKNSRMDMRSQTDSSIKDTEQSGNQQTLPSLLSSDLDHLDPDKAWDVIFPHGPSHQGPSTMLTVHVES